MRWPPIFICITRFSFFIWPSTKSPTPALPRNTGRGRHSADHFMRLLASFVLVVLLLAGCKNDPPAAAQEVTLYTSVDQPVAAPIVQEFERRTGIKVHLVTDTEATKSAGLAARLLAEKANPQADVFWGNEVFHSI